MDQSKADREAPGPATLEAALFVSVDEGRRGLVPYWVRSQISGLVVGLLACAAVWLVIGGLSVEEFGVSLVITVVYSLSIGGLVTATLPMLPVRIRTRPSLRDSPVFLLFILVAASVGSALAASILLVLGVFPPDELWSRGLFVSRIAVFVTVVFAAFAYAHGSIQSRLEESSRDLKRQVERRSQELQTQQLEFEAAREIQVGLLPSQLPDVEGYSLAGCWQPARRIGGDYFDVLNLSRNRLGLCIADVVGKGASAALLMANLQAVVKAFADGSASPVELCERANAVIVSNIAPGKFITFFYAVLEPPGGRLAYCNAGHNPPLVLRREGPAVRLATGGPVLGILSDARYEQGSVDLVSGDTLVLYTDGLTEVTNPQEEEFGEQRLAELAKTAPGGSDAARLQAHIMSAAKTFAEGQFHDDATILVLTVD
jgi:serine phosphatase RsbU (regulator of sigma subunit)